MDMMNNTSSINITMLEADEIFVFGSNEAGIHGAGAALLARKWGAVTGEPVGLHGNTYAIPTKNKRIKTLTVSAIHKYINDFIDFAKDRPHLKFLVTEIGCGLAGYKPLHIAPLFKRAINVDNIFLPKTFLVYLNKVSPI